MRIKKPNVPSTSPPRAAPTTPAAGAAPRSSKFWLVLVLLVLVVGAVGWGAWSLWRSDPLREVHAALDRRDFRAADELLAKRLVEDPDDRGARLLAARSARRAGDFGRALRPLKSTELAGTDALSI